MFSLLCVLTLFIFREVECLRFNDETCKNKECVLFSSIMDSLISPSKSPCTNFFDFACGKFIKSTIVHDRYGEQGFTTAATEKAEEKIRKLLNSDEKIEEIRPFKLVKETYKMCINHDQLNEDGKTPLTDLIENLGGWSLLSKGLHIPPRTWQEMYEKILEKGFVADTFMSVYLAPNPKNTSVYTVKVTPPGVEDFNRGYYDLLPEGLNNTLVNAYYTYMKEYTVLIGANSEEAEREMFEVLELEKKMFEIVKKKNPNGKPAPKPIKLEELQEKFPFVEWKRFIETYLGSVFELSGGETLILLDELYFQNIAQLVKNTPIRTFENYFFWRVIDHSKFYLSVALKRPALKLHEVLYGRQTAEQQWRRCVSHFKILFGIAVTAMTARSEQKQGRLDINIIIESVRQQVLQSLQLIPISSALRENIVKKISSLDILVGYSDEFFKDEPLEEFYKDLKISSGEYFKSAINLEVFSMKSYGRRYLKPIADTRWESSVGNSYEKSFYSRLKKTIFIHPNDLKSPIYNNELPSYVNYARLGWQVGNLFAIAISFELEGKNETWYEDLSQHIRDQYQDYVKENYNMTVDGSKAFRINFADFLSYTYAYKAMKFETENLAEKPLALPGLHYSVDQFFWISAMQRYCHVNKDQETLQKLVLSNFPIESFRANNPLLNNFDFHSDFNCGKTDDVDKHSMYPRSFQRRNSAFKNTLSRIIITIAAFVHWFGFI